MENHNGIILKCISKVQNMYIKEKNKVDIFEELLNGMLEISESEYGFIGEILHNDNIPYLKTLAITDISWNDELRKNYQLFRTEGMTFTNLNTLFGLVIMENTIIISNDPANDPRRGGYQKTPVGHPPLRCFLGIPFNHGDKLIGMIGIANVKSGSYNNHHVELCQPFADTCSTLIDGYRSSRLQRDAVLEKQNFFRLISHELRTPLNAIIGYSQLIDLVTNDPQIKEYVKHINNNNLNLLKLIDELLNYSKLNTTNFGEKQLIQLDTLVNSRVFDLKDNNTDNNSPITIDIYPVQLEVNVGMLEKIFNNLISNAIKYSTSNNPINIKSKLIDNHKIKIMIQNTSNLITKEDLLYLGNPLYRSKKVRHISGNVLGLSIVSKCLENINGNIEFFLLSPNIFLVEVTLDYKTLIQDELNPNMKVIGYLEDQKSNQQIMKEIFKIKMPTYKIIVYDDYASFKNKIEKLDLLLCDLGLPDVSLDELKSRLSTLAIPVVIVTADVTSVHDEALNTVAKEILTKPLLINNVVKVVEKIFETEETEETEKKRN